jgi:hypothetical protein
MYIQLEYLHLHRRRKNNATHALNALSFVSFLLSFIYSFIHRDQYTDPGPNLNQQEEMKNELSKRFITNAKEKQSLSSPRFAMLKKLNENFETGILSSDTDSWTSGIVSIRSVCLSTPKAHSSYTL